MICIDNDLYFRIGQQTGILYCVMHPWYNSFHTANGTPLNAPSSQYHYRSNMHAFRLHVQWRCVMHGPLTRYVKLRVAHATGMPGTPSPPPQVSDPNMHHGTCVTHVPYCMPGSLTSGFLWSRWCGKYIWHPWRMRNPQFYVFGKRSMALWYA